MNKHDMQCPVWDFDNECDDCCRCDIIAKVRQDERERAGIEQTVPSYEYPFTTVVTVEAAMTEMNRFKWTSFGPWLDEDGPFVLFADAEAAIAAAQADATVLQAFQRGVKAGYATGLTDVADLVREAKADMLAKCIDWMLDPSHHPSEEAAAWAYAFAEALRALEEQA